MSTNEDVGRPCRASIGMMRRVAVASTAAVGLAWASDADASAGVRGARAAWTWCACAWDYAKARRSPSELEEERWKQAHENTAARLLELAKKHGGAYVKAAQMAATVRAVPQEVRDALAQLHDRAPVRPFADVDASLRASLGAGALELYASFEEQAAAAASLAQVHRARTHDGRDVAVKVQHAGLLKEAQADIATFRWLAKAAKVFFEGFELEWMVPELERNMEKELDFVREGKNAERTAKNFAHRPGLVVPSIVWQLTTKQVLTMEWTDGLKITDVEGIEKMGFKPALVAEKMAQVFADMIFLDGFVHCDPHPGNLLVRSRKDTRGNAYPEIVLLDHGLYVELRDPLRRDWCLLWKSLVLQDKKELTDVSRKLLGPFGEILPAILSYGSSRLELNREQRHELRSKLKMSTVGDFVKILEDLPRPLLLALRSNGLVRNVVQELGVKENKRLRIQAMTATRGLAYRAQHDRSTDTDAPFQTFQEPLGIWGGTRHLVDLARVRMRLDLVDFAFFLREATQWLVQFCAGFCAPAVRLLQA